MTAVAREHIIHHASNDCGSSLPTKKKKNDLIKDKKYEANSVCSNGTECSKEREMTIYSSRKQGNTKHKA